MVPNAVSSIFFFNTSCFNLRTCRETLEDGTVFIVSCATSVCPVCDLIILPYRDTGAFVQLGGCKNGGYVNAEEQDNPTYEFFPSRGPPVRSPILTRTLPVNLFALTWLLPSGRLFIQSNWDTVLLDYNTGVETPLENMPDAVRVYPSSAGTIMLPLTPANNYTATILFCGGSNIATDRFAYSLSPLHILIAPRWTAQGFIAPSYPASTSCVSITPDSSKSYQREQPLPEPRVMTNFIFLPNGRILNINGAKMGKT